MLPRAAFKYCKGCLAVLNLIFKFCLSISIHPSCSSRILPSLHATGGSPPSLIYCHQSSFSTQSLSQRVPLLHLPFGPFLPVLGPLRPPPNVTRGCLVLSEHVTKLVLSLCVCAHKYINPLSPRPLLFFFFSL